MNHRHSISHRLAFFILAFLVLSGPGATGCGKGGDKTELVVLKRIILISCDALSAQHMPAYGYGEATTVAFDSLAAQGVLFEHCLAPQGWTLTSHMSMLTGLAPGVHRVGQNNALSRSIPTLPEILHAQGYITGGFPTSNHWLGELYGFDRGFDEYRFFSYEVVSNLDRETADWIADWAREHIPLNAQGGNAAPYFLFLHFMDVHSRPSNHPFPYWTPNPAHRAQFGLPADYPERNLTAVHGPGGDFEELYQWNMSGYDRDTLRRGYDACLRTWDEHRLRRTLEALRETGHLRDALVIITADHGEEIGEHGGYYHDSPYGEVREVPLLLVWPDRLPAGAVVGEPVSLMDLLPTILDLAGLAQTELCQGRSLRPLWEDPGAVWPKRDFLVDGLWKSYKLEPAALVAWAEDRWWSLVVQPDTTGIGNSFRPARVDSVIGLYDLRQDPGERRNLRQDRPDLVDRLRRRLEEKMQRGAYLGMVLARSSQGEEIELTPEAQRQLRALGY